MLEEWIDWVSGKMEDDLNNVVKVDDKTVYLDGDGSSFIYPPFFPVVALNTDGGANDYDSLQYRASATASWTAIVTNSSYIYIDAEVYDRIELLGNNVFPEGDKNIKVRYWAGWQNVPGSITLAVLEGVQTVWNMSKQGENQLGKSSMSSSMGGGAESAAFIDATPRWKEVIRRYKRRSHNVGLYR
jgi:hypothetical protein